MNEDLSLLIQRGGKSKKRYERLCQLLSQEHFESKITKASSDIPDIYDTFWPFFCVNHLIQNPEDCSSWTLTDIPLLEHKIESPALAFIDLQLFQRIGDKWRLLPQLYETCDYGTCHICKKAIIRSYSDDGGYIDGKGNCFPGYIILYRCPCLEKGKWREIEVGDCEYHVDSSYCRTFKKNIREWHFCHKPTIFPGYFFDSYRAYFSLFEGFLNYQEQNPQCDCYWPIDNDLVSLSAFVTFDWIANRTDLMQVMKESKRYPFLQYYSPEEFIRGLILHAYFYSDYLKIINDLETFGAEYLSQNQYARITKKLAEFKQWALPYYQKRYSRCLNSHPHPKIFYERGMVLFHQGENLDSLEDIRKFISYAEKNDFQDLLTSDLYLNEGRLLSESLSYDEAIVALTKIISKDPGNKEAYFERAIAYFEAGDFQQAFSDYLASGFRPKTVDPKAICKLNSLKFGQGIALGMLKGGKDSTLEFVPSLLSSLRGLGHGLWVFVSSPIAVSQDMIDCANACMEFIKETTTKELINTLAPEIQECLKKWDSLSDAVKGEAIGYVLGKYGVDIFIGSGSVKAIQLYRNLRKANALMTLETASISQKHAKEVLAQAAKEWKIREEVFKNGNLKIQWDKQGKHIPGHKNYMTEKNKSIVTHEHPQELINKYAGTGKKLGNELPGDPGFKEEINFHEIIGYAVDRETGEKLPTTWGRIHYAKDGLHIVPSKPRG